MKYSVLVPVYNCSEAVVSTIESIQGSGLTDFEILVINDGSTDGTSGVLEEMSKCYSNITVLTKPNGGVSSARNLGLSHAKGEYLLFVDADDALKRDCYLHAAEIVEAEKPDMLMFGMRFEHYYKGICYQTGDYICSHAGKYASGDWLSLMHELFHCNYLSPIWNKMIRRDLVLQHNIRFNENMFLMEDCKFTLDCLRFCSSIYLLSEPVYCYRLFDDSGKATARIQRIQSLSEYIKHFSALSAAYSGIVRDIYYMLLSQRIGAAATVSQLKAEALDYQASPYWDAPLTGGSSSAKLLKEHRYFTILWRNYARKIRHHLAVLYKTIRQKRRIKSL